MSVLRSLAFMATINTFAIFAIHFHHKQYTLFYQFGFWERAAIAWPWLLLAALTTWIALEKPSQK